ncbi:PH domain-containing protein [Rhizobium sp. KVB221]|uniref:PH domain-containing protein n=1 Tax=Rhizobium setariae TaxID=2801340 RepID=A0A936YQY5_9HYPH|nr:PH domain-containing protein [Rhizobium setariae]MBL0372604.1 PH domain-containing protein [Rhizobium setariae]
MSVVNTEEAVGDLADQSARRAAGGETSNVEISGAYSVFFWLNAIFWTVLISIPTLGAGLLLILIFLWYKKAVLNRTKIIFTNGTKLFTAQKGRWFVKDDDVVPVKAVDNVKIDRSILGKIFGWCDIIIETRSEAYRIRHVNSKRAERFRKAFLASV